MSAMGGISKNDNFVLLSIMKDIECAMGTVPIHNENSSSSICLLLGCGIKVFLHPLSSYLSPSVLFSEQQNLKACQSPGWDIFK
jgi:hypothetical protein